MIILMFASVVNKIWNSRKHKEADNYEPSWIDNMIDRKISGTL